MHLTLHLTARCNMRCRYCYDAPHEGGDMAAATAEAAISLAVAETDKETPGGGIGLTFYGGEPLLRRALIAHLIRHCWEIERTFGRRFYLRMNTNGLLLDEQFLGDSLTSTVFIALSHDGSRAAHNANRLDAAGRGTHDRLARTIGLLLSAKPYAPVMAVVRPETVASYAESVQYHYRRGFRYLIYTLDFAADWRPGQLGELRRQYLRLADWYERATMNEEKFYFSPFEAKIASHIHPGGCRAERCELGQCQISVAPNGRLYPCVQFVGNGGSTEYSLGHVETGLDEEARWRIHEKSMQENAACQACAIRERCNHYCGCVNRAATGRLDRVPPVLCAHERILLPIADALAERLYKKHSGMFVQKHYNEFYPLLSLAEDRGDTGC